jgi:hypothetical protein
MRVTASPRPNSASTASIGGDCVVQFNVIGGDAGGDVICGVGSSDTLLREQGPRSS